VAERNSKVTHTNVMR